MASELVVKVLTEARSLIAERSAWTQGTFARDAAGVVINAGDPTAVCFCSLGAIFRSATNERLSIIAADILQEVTEDRGFFGPVSFNDSHKTSHKDVLSAFDEAITRASKGVK